MVEGPWTVVAADIMEPLPKSKAGFQYVLVVQDLFTKLVENKALRAATGPKIEEALEDLIVSRWGTPKILLTDNGTEFVNKVIKEFVEENGITHTVPSPSEPSRARESCLKNNDSSVYRRGSSRVGRSPSGFPLCI